MCDWPATVKRMEAIVLNNRSSLEVQQRGFLRFAQPCMDLESVEFISSVKQLNSYSMAMPALSKPISIMTDSAVRRTQSKHWKCQVWSKPLPRGAICLLNERGVYVSSPAFCFMQMAPLLTLPDAIRLGMELCGTHSTLPFSECEPFDFGLTATEVRNGFANVTPIINAEQLRRELERLGAGKESRAVVAARYVLDRSRSPGESRLYILLCLPVKMGGYGLPKPKLNVRIDLPEELWELAGTDHFICDLYYPGLAIEYDGGYHWEGEQRMSDNLRQLILEKMGIEVRRIDKLQLQNPEALDMQARIIAERLKVRMRTPGCKALAARKRLRAETLDWTTNLYG